MPKGRHRPGDTGEVTPAGLPLVPPLPPFSCVAGGFRKSLQQALLGLQGALCPVPALRALTLAAVALQ